jgi:hypothetical protein
MVLTTNGRPFGQAITNSTWRDTTPGDLLGFDEDITNWFPNSRQKQEVNDTVFCTSDNCAILPKVPWSHARHTLHIRWVSLPKHSAHLSCWMCLLMTSVSKKGHDHYVLILPTNENRRPAIAGSFKKNDECFCDVLSFVTLSRFFPIKCTQQTRGHSTTW